VRLSPDGKQAVYVTQQADRSQQLWVVNLSDGSPKALFEAGKVTDIRARWSPDGKRIAVSNRQFDLTNGPFFHGKETSISLMDAAGQNSTPLKQESVGGKGPSLQLTDWR
jgi:Tol biopolymer transport system component